MGNENLWFKNKNNKNIVGRAVAPVVLSLAVLALSACGGGNASGNLGTGGGSQTTTTETQGGSSVESQPGASAGSSETTDQSVGETQSDKYSFNIQEYDDNGVTKKEIVGINYNLTDQDKIGLDKILSDPSKQELVFVPDDISRIKMPPGPAGGDVDNTIYFNINFGKNSIIEEIDNLSLYQEDITLPDSCKKATFAGYCTNYNLSKNLNYFSSTTQGFGGSSIGTIDATEFQGNEIKYRPGDQPNDVLVLNNVGDGTVKVNSLEIAKKLAISTQEYLNTPYANDKPNYKIQVYNQKADGWTDYLPAAGGAEQISLNNDQIQELLNQAKKNDPWPNVNTPYEYKVIHIISRIVQHPNSPATEEPCDITKGVVIKKDTGAQEGVYLTYEPGSNTGNSGMTYIQSPDNPDDYMEAMF